MNILRELKAQLEEKRTQAKAEADKGNVAEAKALIAEMKDIKDKIDVQEALIEDEKGQVSNKVKQSEGKNAKNIAKDAFKAFVTGKQLTEDMKNAVVVSEDGAALVPTELVPTLLEAKAQRVSLKDYVQVIPVSAPSGSVPVEKDAGALLVDFDELGDLEEQGLAFESVKFAVKSKGALTPVTKSLVADSAFGIPAIVETAFARKAVRTENNDILTVAKAGKTAVALTDIASLRKSVNKDLDPAARIGGVIVMNQDAYDVIDGELDSNGRPLLTQSVTDPNIKIFKDMEVVVLSNKELPTVAGKAPMFYGSLQGVLFFDREQYEVAVSEHSMFNKNAIAFRIIERYDVKGGTTEDFVYAEMTIPAEA